MNPGIDFDKAVRELKIIWEQLEKAESVYIFVHYIPDGDCMGSSAALCGLLRRMGKTCHIIMEDDYPANLAFLDRGFVLKVDENEENCVLPPAPDVSIALDCSDLSRFPRRVKCFESGRVKCCIDHHDTNKKFADYACVDPNAAATCELIYILFTEAAGIQPEKEEGEAIFTGIMTDSGNFQYSDTTSRTHRIAADLYDLGIDAFKVNVAVNQSESIGKVKLHSRVVNNAEVFCDGKALLAYCTPEILEECGAEDSDTNGISSDLRNIDGIEVSVLVRRRPSGEIKCSMRSKNYLDVAKITGLFGGGGHKKASGFSMKGVELEDVMKQVKAAVEEEMKNISPATEA